MNTKLQELTEKIYKDGVEKGNEEATKIIADAKLKADNMLKKAKEDAAQITAEAKIQASELNQNTKSELKLFANQAVNDLKTNVANLLSQKIAKDSVKAATADATFMQKTIANMCEVWAKDGEISISAQDSKALEDYFTANAKNLLNNGVKIQAGKNLKSEFSITLVKSGYKMTFGEAEFTEYFKEFLRPQLVEMLF